MHKQIINGFKTIKIVSETDSSIKLTFYTTEQKLSEKLAIMKPSFRVRVIFLRQRHSPVVKVPAL